MIASIINVLLIILFLYLSGRKVHRCFLQNKYKTVIESLDYFLGKTYDIIYNDQIIAYTASGQKIIPPDEMETIERNFIKLGFEIMGSENVKMYLMYFGSETTLINNMLTFVRKELAQDALARIVQEHESQSN